MSKSGLAVDIEVRQFGIS